MSSRFGLENAVPTNDWNKSNNYITSCMETDKYKLTHVEQVFERYPEHARQAWLCVSRKSGFREFVKTNSKESNPLFATLLYFRHKRALIDYGFQNSNMQGFKSSAYDSFNDGMRRKMSRIFDHFFLIIPAAAVLAAVLTVALIMGFDDVVKVISVAVSISAMIVVTWWILVVNVCKEAQRKIHHMTTSEIEVTSEEKEVLGEAFYFSTLPDSSTIAEFASLPFASFPYNRTDGMLNPSADKWCRSTELFAGLAALSDNDIDEMCDFMLNVQRLKRSEPFHYAPYLVAQKYNFGKSKRFFKIDLPSMFTSASYNGLVG